MTHFGKRELQLPVRTGVVVLELTEALSSIGKRRGTLHSLLICLVSTVCTGRAQSVFQNKLELQLKLSLLQLLNLIILTLLFIFLLPGW